MFVNFDDFLGVILGKVLLVIDKIIYIDVINLI